MSPMPVEVSWVEQGFSPAKRDSIEKALAAEGLFHQGLKPGVVAVLLQA